LQDVRQQLAHENEELKLTIEKLLARLRGNRSERNIDDPDQLATTRPKRWSSSGRSSRSA
jgi:hypothetical protein